MTQLLLFNVFNGLIIGAFYALMALGLSLILNLSGVINFAHGGFLAIGGYLAYTLIPYLGFWGALVVAPFLTAFIGILVERVLIRRLYGRDPLYSLLLTFGLAFMIEDGTRFIWGAQSLPFSIPGWLVGPLSNEFFFLTGYRVFMVLLVTLAVAGLFVILNYTRLGIRIRAGTLDLETVSVLGVNVRVLRNLNFGLGIYLAGLAGVLAVGMLGPAADDRRQPHHAELHRHHRRRPRQPARHAAGRIADRRRLGRHQRVLPVGERGGDLCDDGGGADRPAARAVRRGRALLMPKFDKRAADVLVWLAAADARRSGCTRVGGYVELGSRVLVFALAAMALNFLLGYTGVLSFGHAAYFGLGAYGTALTIKYLCPSTPLGMLVGILVGTVGRRADRPDDRAAARRLFRHVHHRLRPGVLFHRLPVVLGHRRRRRRQRLAPHAARSRLHQHRHPQEQQGVLLLRAGGVRGLRGGDGVAAALAVRPHAVGDPRERAPRALSRHSGRPAHLGVLGHFLPLRQRRRHALSRC